MEMLAMEFWKITFTFALARIRHFSITFLSVMRGHKQVPNAQSILCT